MQTYILHIVCCFRGNELRTKLNALKVELDNMLETVRTWDYDQMSDAEFEGHLAKVKKVLQDGKLVRAQAKAVARELVPYLVFAPFFGLCSCYKLFGHVLSDFTFPSKPLLEAK